MFRVLYHYDVMHIISCEGKLLYPRTVSEEKVYLTDELLDHTGVY